MKNEMAVSFFLACAVVVGVLWLVSESEQQMQNQKPPDTETKTLSSPTANQPNALSPSTPKLNTSVREVRSSPGQVVKCTVNGRTIYSNTDCPTGARTHQVQLHDTAGVVSPPKAVLSELTAQRRASEKAQVQSLQKPVALPVPSKEIECAALDKRIEWLDSMARQPQSGQMQDWIRQERKTARDRQFAIKC